MEPQLLILDDLEERETGFASALSRLSPPIEWQLGSNSVEFLSLAESHSRLVRVVSLDHDLDPRDALDGLDVVRLIIERGLLKSASFVIHSSNSDRAAVMAVELELDRRTVQQVAPFGDDWVRSQWIPAVKSLLAVRG